MGGKMEGEMEVGRWRGEGKRIVDKKKTYTRQIFA
jgi:hypothetical protein